MRIDGRDYRSLWPAPDGNAVEAIDQTALPHRFVTARLADLDDAVARHPRHGGSRRAADRRDRGLWAGAGAAPTPPTTTRSRAAYRALIATPADRGQSEARARRHTCAVAPLAALRARRGGLARARSRICEEDVAINRGIGEAGLRADRGDRIARSRAGGQRPHPLQRRLARDRRLGHGDGADLSGARQRHARSRLGRRDAAAQPGRVAHRLGARPARRAAHA